MPDFFENLIPLPRRILHGKRSQPAPKRLYVSIAVDDESEVERLSRVVLQPWLGSGAKRTRRLLNVNVKLDRSFRIRGAGAGLHEAYELVIGAGVRLRAATVAGLRHGLQTLRQVLENAEQTGALPHCRITDWPRLESRGIHLDLAREMEYRDRWLRRVIENLAYLKLNTLHLYLENKFAYPSAPEIAAPRVMTPKQARQLSRYARLYGVSIIPQIPTLGHMGHLLHGPYAELREDPKSPANICPTHPRTRPFIAGLIADVATAFEPAFIHLGYDESHSGVCARCRLSGSPQKILADHLNWMNTEVKRHGARAMIYGDKFLSREDFPRADAVNGGTSVEARTALARVSRDIIITDWHYTAPYGGTTRYLVEQGFEVHLASATNLYWHDSIPLNRGHHWIVATHDEAIRQGATGGFNCNWEFYRGQLPDNYWYFQGLVAERTWSNIPHAFASWGRRFAGRFWGVTEDYFTELAGLAETLPTGRKKFFLDTHVLDITIPAALNPIYPEWRQMVFDHTETGEYLIEAARRFQRRARRNADTLRLLDMPGQIARYAGIRAHQRILLESALVKADARAAVRCIQTVRVAARQIGTRLEFGWRVSGGAVEDRKRLARQFQELAACETMIRRSSRKRLASLSVEALIKATTSRLSP